MSNLSLQGNELRLLLEGDWVRPSLMLAVMCGSLVIGLAAYLSRTTRKSYFLLWDLAWLFYAVYLLSCFGLQSSPNTKMLEVLRHGCVGITALLVFWSGLHVIQKVRPIRELGLAALGIMIWSYLAVHMVKRAWIEYPHFILLGSACVCSAYAYSKGRQWNRGSKMVACGFLLWGI